MDKRRINNYITLIILLNVLLINSAWGSVNYDEWADIIINARKHGLRIPLLSVSYPKANINTAYRMQRAYVKKRLLYDKIAGLKGALTSKSSQQKYNIKSPLAGVLLLSGKLTGNSTIYKSQFQKLLVETEIGYKLKSPIKSSLKDISSLKEHIKSIIPVIEFPDSSFSDMSSIQVIDIIAANIGADKFIMGEEIPLAELDPNQEEVSLFLDGKIINQGKGTDTLNDQWATLLWVINTMLKQGWKLEPNNIVITGALGKAIPAKAGNYIADYKNLGKIFFLIEKY